MTHPLFQQGLKWCGVYWRKTFSFDVYSVNVAEIPLAWIEQLEEKIDLLDHFSDLLAMRSCGISNLDRYVIYKQLWKDALLYFIGVRKSIKKARALGQIALDNWELKREDLAYLAAKQAYLIELNYSGKAIYWYRLYEWVKKNTVWSK